MSQFRQRIQQTPEYQAASEAAEQRSGQADTVAKALGPVLDAEKTDVQFWTDIAKVVLLFLIWRELQRRGGT